MLHKEHNDLAIVHDKVSRLCEDRLARFQAEAFGEANLDFYLRYRGPLHACTRTDSRSSEKHRIRTYLSPQLQNLWKVDPRLQQVNLDGLHHATLSGRSVSIATQGRISSHSDCFYHIPLKGSRFIPLVIRPLKIICHLDIRFLRRDEPGAIIQGGDLDNRIKTLFDGLRMPLSEDEIPTDYDAGQTCFCLLEDDSLITRVNIDTGRLLGPIQGEENESDVELAIHVSIKISSPMWVNLDFDS